MFLAHGLGGTQDGEVKREAGGEENKVSER